MCVCSMLCMTRIASLECLRVWEIGVLRLLWDYLENTFSRPAWMAFSFIHLENSSFQVWLLVWTDGNLYHRLGLARWWVDYNLGNTTLHDQQKQFGHRKRASQAHLHSSKLPQKLGVKRVSMDTVNTRAQSKQADRPVFFWSVFNRTSATLSFFAVNNI